LNQGEREYGFYSALEKVCWILLDGEFYSKLQPLLVFGFALMD
jgi:hypothetical protein